MKIRHHPPIRCAVIGYGPMHDFGRAHGRWIDATPDHLLHGGPVSVSGEESKRTIAIFEAAERSAQSGRTESVEYE